MTETSLPGPLLRRLKSRGQLLDPVVLVGKSGLTPALLASVEVALNHHELIKVKFEAHKEEKKTLAPELAARSGSRLIQRVGHVVVLYRPHTDPAKRKYEPPASPDPAQEIGRGSTL